MTDDPRSFNFPEVELLRDAQLDNVGRAVLSLTKEICVLSDRLMVLEKVLEEKGVDVQQAIETYQPDEVFQQQLDATKRKIVDTVFNDFTGSE